MAWLDGLGAALDGPVLACGQGWRAAAGLFGLASAIGMELSRPYYEISRRRLEPLAQHYIIEANHA